MGKKKAISHFKKIGEKYKAEIIESIPQDEELSVYHHGTHGMIYVEVLTYHHRVKLVKFLNSQKYQEHIGEVTQTMKCCKEFMVLVGAHKRNWKNI